MEKSSGVPSFARFVRDLRAAWAELTDTEARMERAVELLGALLEDPVLKEHSKTWPSTEGRRNLLLYEDPDHGFAVNAVVRVPGRKGSVHDHAHAWTAYGILDGTETLERFRRVDDRTEAGHARLEVESTKEGRPGTVDLVGPFEIHAEQGGRGRSVAMIVRSERVAGRTTQGSYDPEHNRVRQVDGPIQVPFDI